MKASATYPKIIIHRIGQPAVPPRRLTTSTICCILLIAAILTAGAARIQRHHANAGTWHTCQAN